MTQRGRPRKSTNNKTAAIAETFSVGTSEENIEIISSLPSPKETLERQLEELNDLRKEMQRFGVDSLSKLDAMAGQVIGDLSKL